MSAPPHRGGQTTLLHFVVVSLCGTAVDFSALQLLHARAGVPVLAASLASPELSNVNSFIWSDLWAFRGRAGRGSLAQRFLALNGLYASMIGITLVVIGTLNLSTVRATTCSTRLSRYGSTSSASTSGAHSFSGDVLCEPMLEHDTNHPEPPAG